MISVVIPTYKNKEMLLKNLEHNLKYLKDCEVIIVNDDPQESIKEDIEKLNKDIALIENDVNKGFGPTVNTGARRGKGKHLMLLNTDVVLKDVSFMDALVHFQKDSQLFAVSFAQKDHNDDIMGKNTIYWKRGFLQHKKSRDNSFGATAWAEGGSSIIDKDKFDTLGGFDDLYAPFYWEDIDLSYRAWKAGYKVLFDPSVVVTHHHGTTIQKYFSDKKRQTISFRNQLIFIWKNIYPIDMMLANKLWLVYEVIRATLGGNLSYLKGALQALGRLHIVIKKKIGNRNNSVSDREVLSLFHE